LYLFDYRISDESHECLLQSRQVLSADNNAVDDLKSQKNSIVPPVGKKTCMPTGALFLITTMIKTVLSTTIRKGVKNKVMTCFSPMETSSPPKQMLIGTWRGRTRRRTKISHKLIDPPHRPPGTMASEAKTGEIHA